MTAIQKKISLRNLHFDLIFPIQHTHKSFRGGDFAGEKKLFIYEFLC